MEWENQTEKSPGVPNVELWLDFVRQKAANTSQAQKVGTASATAASATSRPQKEKDFKKKHSAKGEGRVYASHGEPAVAGESDSYNSGR